MAIMVVTIMKNVFHGLTSLVWSFSIGRISAVDARLAEGEQKHKYHHEHIASSYLYTCNKIDTYNHFYTNTSNTHLNLQTQLHKRTRKNSLSLPSVLLFYIIFHKCRFPNWVKLLTSTMLIETVWADYWKNDKVLHN